MGEPIDIEQRGGSRSFMTMTMTIWWPRLGVRIYQIVTGVTSDVGVLSTRLVIFNLLIISCEWISAWLQQFQCLFTGVTAVLS